MCSTLHCIRRKLTEIGDVLQGGSVTMALEVLEMFIVDGLDGTRILHYDVFKTDNDYLD